ncbi:MAG TPA: hypothetical protein VGM25_12245 [Caulobacteraceae bacterium]|jgi:hypothetical protein
MKSLVYGGAAAALLMGLAFQAQAETVVRDAPVHAVPVDEDEAPAAEDAAAPAPRVETPAPAPVIKAEAPAPKAEPEAVKALVQPKAPELSPEENAFFTALGQRVTDAASAYENYVRRAGGIDPAFNGAASVNRAVKLGAAYHPRQLEEGIVAYAALIALRNPEFVDGVRAIQNPAFTDGLAAHPDQVMQVRGAGAAAADAAGVLRAQGEALTAAGKAVTKAAYDIQAQSWSKSPVADPQGVLDGAKTSAEQTRFATVPSKERLLDSLVAAPQGAPAQAGEAASAPAPDVVRGVALAALAILGRTGDGMEAQYEALLHDASAADCLKMAKLNLNQCLAVAGPHYEDAYCTGRHAVSDTGKCIGQAAGGGPALDGAPAPRLQDAEGPGPEQAAVYGKVAPRDTAEDDGDVAGSAPAPTLAAAPPVPAPAPAFAAAAPAPALVPAPRQFAEALPQRAEPMPDPRTSRASAPVYPQPQLQAPPQPYNSAQNDYAPPQPYQQPAYPQQQPYPQAQYQPQPYPQQQQQQQQQQQPYPQPQYAPQQQPYPQAYAQQGYAPQQPYAQPRTSYAPSYGGQSYYPQQQGYPAYQGGYYGR